MPSRMDRYHFEEMTSSKRTKRNEDLYKSIYETGEYSNIEGIASISKKGEINLEKLKDAPLEDLESIIRPVGSFRKKAFYVSMIKVKG